MPTEDAPGYEDFLAALADPNIPQHGELKEWIGGSFDPTAFDVAEVIERFTTLNPDRQGRWSSD